MSTYGFTETIDLPFPDAVEAVREAVEQEGFGILTEINAAQTIEKKLGEKIEPYVILGSCDPANAYQAIQAEPEIGLLLPCNVIVYQSEGVVYASSIKVRTLLDLTGNEGLQPAADDIQERLKQAITTAAKRGQEESNITNK